MVDPLISFGGIASGLDTSAIISALVAFRSRPIDLLAKRQAQFQSLKTRYETLKEKTDALQDAAKDIKSASDFLEFSASSSNASVLDASADSDATPGSYDFTVSKVALNDIEHSVGYTDFESAIGAGSIDVTYGADTTTVTLDPGSSLEDIKDAINNADIGVTASIINTGVGPDPYQLVVSGDDTGAANDVSIDDTNLVYEPAVAALGFTNAQKAQNAEISFGGITFERATNTIDDVVQGITLNLLDTGTSKVTVGADSDAIADKLQKYVDAHNDLISYIDAEIEVSELTGVAGAFNGESTVRKLKDSLLGLHGLGDYPGASNTTLGSLGMELNADGTLTFNAGELSDAIADDLGSVTAALTKVGDFFNEAGFNVVSLDDSVSDGTYDITVTTLATQATVTGGAFTGPLAQEETLTFQVGSGDPVEVVLAAGTSIEDAVEQINDELDDAGLEIEVQDNGGALEFTATEYGSAYDFTVASDVASGGSGVGSTLGANNGTDIAGTINGVAATGEGQVLTGAAGGPAEGISIKYSGATTTSTAQLTVGPDGFFQRVDELLQDYLAPIEGILDVRIEGLEDTVGDLGDRIDDMEDRVEQYQTLLQAKFANLESVIGALQAQQAFLSISQAQLFSAGNSQS